MTSEEFENKVLLAFKNNICKNCADKEICLTNMIDCNQYSSFYTSLKISYGFKKRNLKTAIQISEYVEQLEKENEELKAERNRLIEILNRIDNAEHADLEDYGYNVMEILNDEGHSFWNEWIENDE